MIPNGAKIGRYEVIDRIGSGGMGVVYAARDTVLDRRVALKFLAPAFEWEHASRDRLAREARAASALDHPNICTRSGCDGRGTLGSSVHGHDERRYLHRVGGATYLPG